MIAFSRIMMVLLFAGIAFLLIVPLALRQHRTGLAAAVIVVFVLYLGANVVAWRRMKRHS